LQFAKEFRLAQLLQQANIRKATGVGVLTVFVQLLTVVFSGNSLGRLLSDNKTKGKKDVYYRFMNSTSANWLKFIRLLSSQIIARVMSLFDGFGVMVLDDTLHKRDCSKNVELLARVRDHNDGRYYRGFRCLTLCFHLKNATVPMDFRLLSSRKEKNRLNESRQDLDKRTNAFKLRKYALSNSFDMAFDMIRKQRNLVRHVLFDSWFAMPIMFKTLREMGLHGVGMLKANNTLYRYNGKLYKLEVLYTLVKPFLHRENDVAVLGVELRNGTPLSIAFVFDKRNKRNWLAIGTTDLSLSGQQILTMYARRWNIEVFFKTVKSYLGFARECQSRSFDAIVCSIAVVFTRHMILTWMNLGQPTEETHGQMFFKLFEELRECTLEEALEIVFREIFERLVHYDFTLDISLRDFLATLPCGFKVLQAVA
jgi:hypothetical protein